MKSVKPLPKHAKRPVSKGTNTTYSRAVKEHAPFENEIEEAEAIEAKIMAWRLKYTTANGKGVRYQIAGIISDALKASAFLRSCSQHIHNC